MTKVSFSFRYCLVASFFVLSTSLCGALDGARPTPNFARLSPGLFTTFQVPGALGTYPMGINDSETVTGYYTEPAGTQGGFVRTADGAVETFQVPGSILTEPVGINSAGEVVGYYELTAGVPQAFTRSADGQITTFAAPTDASPTNKIAQPAAMNDAGEIVGNYPDEPQASRSLFVPRLEQSSPLASVTEPPTPRLRLASTPEAPSSFMAAALPSMKPEAPSGMAKVMSPTLC